MGLVSVGSGRWLVQDVWMDERMVRLLVILGLFVYVFAWFVMGFLLVSYDCSSFGFSLLRESLVTGQSRNLPRDQHYLQLSHSHQPAKSLDTAASQCKMAESWIPHAWYIVYTISTEVNLAIQPIGWIPCGWIPYLGAVSSTQPFTLTCWKLRDHYGTVWYYCRCRCRWCHSQLQPH